MDKFLLKENDVPIELPITHNRVIKKANHSYKNNQKD